MTDLLKKILEETEQEFTYAQNMRREFHEYPEIAREEYRTAQRIEEELRSFGLTSKRVGETGVYAEIHGTRDVVHQAVLQDASSDVPQSVPQDASSDVHQVAPQEKVLVLRADIDALPVTEEHECPYQSKIPGKMHACGHDAHTAALLTAAKILSSHREDFAGTVRLVFQPGEEIGYGARVFVDEGYLDGAHRCFGLHTASEVTVGKVVLMPGPNNASTDWFRITITGKPAHVSTPEKGVDALYIASSIVTGAQSITTRRSNPMDPILIGFGVLNAGTAYNIVAEKAVLEGTIRTMTPQVRQNVKAELEKLAQGQAVIYGGTAAFEWKDYTSALINDPQASAEAAKIAAEIFGADQVITSRTPSLQGDDFAEFILKVPGVYAYVGTGNPQIPETTVSHHNSHFDIDERALTIGAKLYAGYALDYLGK